MSTPAPREPRRRLPAEARRELIEQAATEVFAERGYRGAAMDEIARRSGVSVPVLYDHFASKEELHRRLLERHFADLRAIWVRYLGVRGAPASDRMHAAVDAWYAYVEEHPYAGRMLFRAAVADPHAEAIRRDVAAQSKAEILPHLGREEGIPATGDDALALELVWELVRGAMQGLAVWWLDHPEVPRERIVAATLATLWTGLERAGRPA